MSYENYERAQGWSGQTFGACSTQHAAQFEADLRDLDLDLSKPLRVLDIGFGNGAFMGWAKSRGWQCDGVEVNPRMLDRATRSGFTVAGDLDALRATPDWRPYDLITAFDVLEHIDRDSLVPFLSKLHSASTPSTLLFFRFPNGDNPFSLPLQNGDFTHRTAIGQSMLRQIAELADLSVVDLRSPKLALRHAGLKRKMIVYASLPLRWLVGELLRHLFMGGSAVKFTGNLVAVLKTRKP